MRAIGVTRTKPCRLKARIALAVAILIGGSMNLNGGIKVLPPTYGVYQSAFPYFGPREDMVSTSVVTNFDRLVKKPIAWAYFSNNWFKGIHFPTAAVRSIYRAGAVPFVRLMPRSSFDLNDSVYTLQKIIDGRFDSALTRWAQDAKKLGIPLMIEFAGEPNGDWFPWCGANNGGGTTDGYGDPTAADGPERYRDAYRHIVDIFRRQGADDITWVFHVNSGSSPVAPWNTMQAYYPGDDYIDWIGESAYGAQVAGDAWVLLPDLLDSTYEEMCSISPSKPLALLEYGVIADRVRGHKAAWIRGGLDSIRAGRYPRIKGVSYWHSRFRSDMGTYSDMRLNSSPDMLAAYRSEVADPFFVSMVRFSETFQPMADFQQNSGTEEGYALGQNYPNPFNPSTTVKYQIPADSRVTLRVYNSLGQVVVTLVDNVEQAGYQQVEWNATNVASGVYFYRLDAVSVANADRTFHQVKKMILMK